MPDDPTPDPQPPAPRDDLGEAGKRAIAAERDARKKAEQALADLQAQLQELQDKDKSDQQKLADRLTAAEKRAADAEAKTLRMEIASEKGLTAAQARRLVGSTREELEADAADLLSSFTPSTGTPPPAARPEPALAGGSNPTQEPEATAADIRKVIDGISRF